MAISQVRLEDLLPDVPSSAGFLVTGQYRAGPDVLKNALAPIFTAHGGEIVRDFGETDPAYTVLVRGLNEAGLKDIADLPETQAIYPNAALSLC